MTLEAVGDTARIALSADWIELAALISSRQSASSAELIRSRAALEEDEHGLVALENDDFPELLEEEILGSAAELWASDVLEELSERSNSLGSSYPFRLHRAAGDSWRLDYQTQDERHDHLLYVCCLLITARRYGLVLHGLSEMDKVLQIVAYLVAGRLVAGESYWFGYPRPDHSNMRDAVQLLLERMGFSRPSVVPPVWSIGTENDGGIDIVAWRNFGDKLPSRIVLYGQVASGKNWEGKPVTKDSDSTWPSWVGDYGQRYYLPAMFVPWPQYVTVEAAGGRSFRERVEDIALRNEKTYGVTVDRGRIAELAGLAVFTGNDDEYELVSYLSDWLTRTMALLSA